MFRRRAYTKLRFIAVSSGSHLWSGPLTADLSSDLQDDLGKWESPSYLCLCLFIYFLLVFFFFLREINSWNLSLFKPKANTVSSTVTRTSVVLTKPQHRWYTVQWSLDDIATLWTDNHYQSKRNWSTGQAKHIFRESPEFYKQKETHQGH